MKNSNHKEVDFVTFSKKKPLKIPTKSLRRTQVHSSQTMANKEVPLNLSRTLRREVQSVRTAIDRQIYEGNRREKLGSD